MATITKQTIYLDLTPGKVFPVLHVSQGDTGLEALEFKLIQNDMVFNIPAAVTDIQLNGTTPLGVFSYNHASGVNWSGNTVTAAVTQTMTEEAGMVVAELVLLDSAMHSLGSLNFLLSVEPSPYTVAHVSTSDMASIVASLNAAQQNFLMSKSWAVGDTGLRDGEATNNSKYWSEESDKNGERWSVGQIDGSDVPPSDVTHHNNSKWWSSISESWAVGGTGVRSGENTNNSKYYADQSRIEGNGLASVFSDVLDYSAGDYVIHDGILYEFTSNHSAGAWNANEVHAVNMGDEVADLKDSLCKFAPKGQLNVKFLGRLIGLDDYKSCQGFIAREENGTLYIYVCWYNYASGDEQRSVIKKVNAITGEIIMTSNPYYLDHSNDLCTDGDYLYICGYNHNDIYKVDFGTLEILETITLGVRLQAMTYDSDRDVFYGFTSYGTYMLYEFTNDFQQNKPVYAYQPNYGVQSIDYYKGMIFFNENAPDSETIVSVETWTKKGVSLFNEFMSGYYPIGETQGISVYNDDGDFICIGKPRQRSKTSNSYEIGEGIASIGQGNILNNSTYTKRYMSASVIDFTGYAVIDNSKYVYTPYGTAGSPFYNCGDLIICLDAPYYKPIQITIASDMPDELAIIDKTICIEGQGYTIPKCSLINCKGVLSNIVFTTGAVECSDLTIRNVSGISFSLSNVNVIDSNYTNYATSNSYINYGRERPLGQVGTVSGTLTIPDSKPALLLFIVVKSGVFSEPFIIPLSSASNGSIKSDTYEATVSGATITVTNNSGGGVRVIGIY